MFLRGKCANARRSWGPLLQSSQGCFLATSLPDLPRSGFNQLLQMVPSVHSPALCQNLRAALKSKNQISKMRETLSVSYSCFFLLGDINYQEFAKRLWGDIYFNPKT